MMVNIQKKQTMCDRCSYVAFHNRDLNRHKHVMHKIPFNCFRCGSEFDDKSSLLLHIKTNHRPSKYFYPTKTKPTAKSSPKYQQQSLRSSSPYYKNRYTSPPLPPEVRQTLTAPASEIPPFTDPGLRTNRCLLSGTSSCDKHYHCPKKCKHITSYFSHKDELDLHISFFHEEVEKLETKAVEKSIKTKDEKLAEEDSRFFLD